MKNSSDKSLQKIITHVLCSIIFFFFGGGGGRNRAVYETMWKNVVQPDKPKMTIWRKRIACCIPEATNTQSESVILILFHGNNDRKNVPQCDVIALAC